MSYFLTEKAKQQLRLKILQTKSSKERTRTEIKTMQERRHTLFILLLLFRQKYTYHFGTDQDFEEFLSIFDLSGKVFKLTNNQAGISNDKTEYYQNTTMKAGEVIINCRKAVNMHTQQSHSVSYSCHVNRINLNEILDPGTRPAFWHVNLSEGEINDAIHSLCEEGLIRPFTFRGELLHFVVDKALEALLDDCYNVYKNIYNAVLHIWKFLRKPSPEEVAWLELFEGTKRADKIRNEAYKKRKAIREEKRPGFLNWLKEENEEWETELKKMVPQIMTKHGKTIQKYRFPTEKILELINPGFLHEGIN